MFILRTTTTPSPSPSFYLQHNHSHNTYHPLAIPSAALSSKPDLLSIRSLFTLMQMRRMFGDARNTCRGCANSLDVTLLASNIRYTAHRALLHALHQADCTKPILLHSHYILHFHYIMHLHYINLVASCYALPSEAPKHNPPRP